MSDPVVASAPIVRAYAQTSLTELHYRPEIHSTSLGSPAVGAVAAVHAAHTDTEVAVTLTDDITNPPTPRNITATTAGTNTDVKAIAVVVHGTNAEGAVISETLPVFTVNVLGTVVGNKAFATVTSVVIPAHDGTGATTSIGTGAKLGLGAKLGRNTVLAAFHNGVKETTAPTVAFSRSALEGNTVTLDTALDGSAVIVDHYDS